MHADWQSLTTLELAEMARRAPIAVVVLGATEQHGHHLPLGTDTTIGLGLQAAMLEVLPQELDIICLPSISVGASEEHNGFPGTLSLPATVAIDTLQAYGDSVARADIRRLVIINSHGGNKAVMDIAALSLRQRHNMQVVKATYTRLPPLDGAIDADELRRGLHGGLLETAMMLHLAPDQVNMARARDALPEKPADNALLDSEGAAALAWLAEDLAYDGISGNASSATAQLGSRLVHHYGRQLAKVVQEAAALPLPATH
ncbi:creatininase family protein [Vreelandella aquamarina]